MDDCLLLEEKWVGVGRGLMKYIICTGDSQLSRGVTYPASNKPKDADLSECLQEDILKQDRKKSPQCIVCPLFKGFWELHWSSEYKNGFFFI